VQGHATFTASPDFNSLLHQLRERGVTYFIIELTDCAIMDSTFLGVLAGFGLKANQDNGHGPCGVELRNANARIQELLENIGVLQLFKITQGELDTPEKLETMALECLASSKHEVTRTCLEAHKTLIAINPENEARFKDVTKFLAEDLARMAKPT
jgi:anti-sigma B factor antagonist